MSQSPIGQLLKRTLASILSIANSFISLSNSMFNCGVHWLILGRLTMIMGVSKRLKLWVELVWNALILYHWCSMVASRGARLYLWIIHLLHIEWVGCVWVCQCNPCFGLSDVLHSKLCIGQHVRRGSVCWFWNWPLAIWATLPSTSMLDSTHLTDTRCVLVELSSITVIRTGPFSGISYNLRSTYLRDLA